METVAEMATLKLKTRRDILMFINAGYASLKENLNGLRLKLIILFIISIFISGCSEFALLGSASSVVASQNAYSKAYGALDFGVVIKTKKDIKTHAYTNAKKYLEDKQEKVPRK